MFLTVMAYLMLATFMFVIMRKKMSPFTALVMVPLVFSIITLVLGINKTDGPANIGDFVLDGISQTSNTGIMILFAILFFSIMLDVGLFDPVTEKMIHFAKGDPMRVLIGTAVVAAVISLNGDGTTTTLITCSAFIPIYKKLDMKMMNLAVLIILQNTILNLLPWSGPTARVMPVMHIGTEILSHLILGMILSIAFVIFYVAPSMGRKERKRLGIVHLTDEEINELVEVKDPELVRIRRPKNFVFNAILTIGLIVLMVAGSFISAIEIPPLLIFLVGTCLALIINYPHLSDQSERIGANAGDALQTVILIFAAGIFMGLFQGTGMASALAESFVNILPKELGGFWGIFVSIISIPGTFFISNDGFYFGVLPALAETGRLFGFTNMEIGLASLTGQAFHLLSPLIAFIYILFRLTKVDMGEWQKASAKYLIVIYLIFVVTMVVTGSLRVYIPQ